MKKITLFILVTIISPLSMNGQIIFTDSVQYQLRSHLYHANDGLDPDEYENYNLYIRSWISNKLITEPNQISEPIDIWSFIGISPHSYEHVLFTVNKKSHLINMNQSYEDVIQDLIDYFKANPDIDNRLLPLFIHKIHTIYLVNTTKNQKGQWYNLWYQRDSLSKQLNLKFENWIN